MITRRELLGGTTIVAAGFLTGLRPQDRKLVPTESNIEGPYYRKEAPFRNKLATGLKGEALKITGKVLSPDGTPLRSNTRAGGIHSERYARGRSAMRPRGAAWPRCACVPPRAAHTT